MASPASSPDILVMGIIVVVWGREGGKGENNGDEKGDANDGGEKKGGKWWW